ncbi:hypothetical protein P872_23385 [Rhodonellum psychrophilum GCM71 = DSM 17998]|uniref:GH16 domain-containing protein n=2 Tax=Rhodonellum TaxID=336827 RepID=U5C8W3_9BACT|nr:MULTISPECIES: glycoside hydrolase family 16 protein [Rhodonellum]ERM84657.1 hypothetical protein P872_23385 [Rhodonellum psychrophilum GCM71 = DSM 17998]SDZ13726.1 Glycosyl hydrolases family 16 [Rhodonellum ikkaensis]
MLENINNLRIGTMNGNFSLTSLVWVCSFYLIVWTPGSAYAQNPVPTLFSAEDNKVYTLIWSDEFDNGNKPDSSNWSYEIGFVRNNELQYYQEDNAAVQQGLLIIEGRREKATNQKFDPNSQDWRRNSEFSQYTSSSINTRGKMEFQYGIVEVRAKIDTAMGMWPAIWTLGVSKPWPSNGEIDVMEFYRRNDNAFILANAAWKGTQPSVMWDEAKFKIEGFIEKNSNWPNEFHVWTMDWNEGRILLYLDGELLNEIDLSKTINPDGFNPFHQPHYLLLNLAIGSNGGDPSNTLFPKTYEVDYARVFQQIIITQ